MKKYFMKGTDDELNIGDMIELDLTKDLPNGKVRHHHLECKFIPDLIPTLLESGVIEEEDEEEDEEKEELGKYDEMVAIVRKLSRTIDTTQKLVLQIDHMVETTLKAFEEGLSKLENDNAPLGGALVDFLNGFHNSDDNPSDTDGCKKGK